MLVDGLREAPVLPIAAFDLLLDSLVYRGQEPDQIESQTLLRSEGRALVQ